MTQITTNQSSEKTPSTQPISPMVTIDSAPAGTCCGGILGSCPIHRAMWGLTAAIVFFGTMTLGYLYWLNNQTAQSPGWQFPATVDATSAVSNDKYSIATGPLSEEVEGLFVLDHNSGLLQCKVMYPRAAQFLGMFAINVGDALGAADKGGSYMMVTGLVDFPASSSRPAASTVVYVLNSATGNYAAYGIPFDRTAISASRAQQGPLVLLATGQSSPIVDRDSLR